MSMKMKDFKGIKLSNMGFGAMRLPTLENGEIDEEQVFRMTDYAIEHGVNYFDTAYPYHGGKSEIVMGKALKRHPRESFYLATKFPGHQIRGKYKKDSIYDPATVFADQLKKCQVDYFDFYLMHNISDHALDTYMDPEWGIFDYFIEQKKLGKIKYLGFSTHGSIPCMAKVIEKYGEHLDFCQIQLNYLDWTLQNAMGKWKLLQDANMPIWVMEPLRGGKLANMNEENTAKLKALRPDESIASWGYRWLQGIPGVTMVLSGMSDFDQMVDNVKTFSEGESLKDNELDLLFDMAEGMKNAIPCTACRYCCAGCPKGLDIPNLLRIYNDFRYAPNLMTKLEVMGMKPEALPDACIGCGKCRIACPQNIDIPTELKGLAKTIKELPDWEKVCQQRDAEQLAARQI